METGKSYIVYVKEDEESHRLMASAKVEKYLATSTAARNDEQPNTQVIISEMRHGTEVDCLIWQKTDLGFKVIIENKYQGQIYDNQVFQPLHTGERVKAYVDHIRQDGKIDLTLQPTGRKHALDFAEVLLRYLYENNGYCELSDKSPAEIIADRFKVSKKIYKKAIGDLYRRRLIEINDDGIKLV
jgi:predicted RNA-binding protein (virulence factor B family)